MDAQDIKNEGEEKLHQAGGFLKKDWEETEDDLHNVNNTVKEKVHDGEQWVEDEEGAVKQHFDK